MAGNGDTRAPAREILFNRYARGESFLCHRDCPTLCDAKRSGYTAREFCVKMASTRRTKGKAFENEATRQENSVTSNYSSTTTRSKMRILARPAPRRGRDSLLVPQSGSIIVQLLRSRSVPARSLVTRLKLTLNFVKRPHTHSSPPPPLPPPLPKYRRTGTRPATQYFRCN